MSSAIPIQNIFYMLSYAWDRLEQARALTVDFSEMDTPRDLLVRLLINGTKHILRRGMWRDYSETEDSSRTVRGKILLDRTIKKDGLINGRLDCRFGHLSPNALVNQIIISTMRALLNAGTANELHKKELRSIVAGVPNVATVILNNSVFELARTHRNNAYYDLVLKVCRLIYRDLMPDEALSAFDFFDFERNPKEMAQVFERFVRNFYKLEQTSYRVDRRTISWVAEPIDEQSEGYLPRMETDICLDSVSGHETIVIDTKYYGSALNTRFGSESIHSENLYQIYTYLAQTRLQDSFDGRKLRGILLYPQTLRPLSLHYRVQQDLISICTVDLSQDWDLIHRELINVLSA